MFLRYPVKLNDQLFCLANHSLYKCQQGQLSCVIQSSLKIRSLYGGHGVLYFCASSGAGLDIYKLIDNNPVRVTFISAPFLKITYTDGARVFFIGPSEISGRSMAFSVDLVSLHVMPLGLFTHVLYSSDGILTYQINGYGYSTFNQYQGGAVGKIYQVHRADISSQAHSCVLLEHNPSNSQIVADTMYNCVNPVIINDLVYYLSDESGVGNIYCAGQRLTDHEYYVHDLFTDGVSLYYSCAGDLYEYNEHGSSKFELDTSAYQQQLSRRIAFGNDTYAADYSDSLYSFDLSSEHILCVLRGQLFISPKHNATARRLTAFTDFTHASFCGTTIAAVRAGICDKVVLLDITGKLEFEFVDARFGHITAIKICKEKILVTNNKNQLFLLEHKVVQMLKDSDATCTSMDISSDGRYIAYTVSGQNNLISEIRIFDDELKNEVYFPDSHLYDSSPVFTDKGLCFLSNRQARASYDELGFDIGFTRTIKPFIFTNCDLFNTDSTPSQNVDDWNTIYAFDVKHASYIALASGKNCLLILENNTDITTRKKGETRAYKLSKYSFDDHKLHELHAHVVDFRVCDELVLIFTGKELELIHLDESKFKKPFENDGKIDWHRFVVRVEQQKEFEVIFDQAYGFMTQLFHNPAQNIDYQAVYSQYKPFVSKVSTRCELNFVISQMKGCFKSSHAYVLQAGDVQDVDSDHAASLGIDDFLMPSGLLIQRIYSGKSYAANPNLRSPLEGLCSTGEVITHIDQQPISSYEAYYLALENKAGQYVQITTNRKTVLCKPIVNNSALKYEAWVQRNREISSQRGIGYIHIPNMDVSGYKLFCEQFYKQFHMSKIIIDVRYNGGGHVSPMILKHLLLKKQGTMQTAGYTTNFPEVYAPDMLAFLCNAQTGSDGDIFCHMVNKLNLGELIGKRTWGGTIGILPQSYTIDLGLTSQPAFNIDLGLTLENKGVEPTVEVAGELRQLETALDLLSIRENMRDYL